MTLAEKHTDEALLSLSSENHEYFYQLMKRYEPKLLRYIRKMIPRNPDDAEDVLQEVFLKVYKNQKGFNPKLKFSSWIYRITHNEIVNLYRKKKSEKGILSIDDTDRDNRALNHMLADTLDIQKDYLSGERREKVLGALSHLPASYRDMLVLRYFEEKSYSEISDILRKPPGTVATTLNRAKDMLKKHLATFAEGSEDL